MTIDNRTCSRRDVLAAAAGATVMAATGSAMTALAATTIAVRKFPKNFRWGVATAGHQIEGNNVNSDYWLLENVEPTAFVERSGDACDSYHRYEEDIALLAGLGFNSYRFSLEWSRIEPTRGQFSTAQLDYYQRVLECCLKHRIDPAVTFTHATAPRWFAMAGGWLNPESPALFARFCSTAAKALASDMRFAFTINEPQVSKTFRSIDASGSSYFAKHDELERASHAAAARATGSERFVTMSYPDIDGMTPQLLAAHEQGFAAIKAERSSLPVGVTLNIIDFQPGNEDSPYLEVRQRAYGDWLECVRRAGDFVGVQIYRQIPVPGKGKALPTPAPMPYEADGGMMSKLSRPEALRNGINYIYEQTRKPILITENGIDTDNDVRRIWYIDAALASVQESLARGVPVLGYFHWSLLDNFEWEQGYKPKYGLIAVDRTTFKRTPKPSAAHLGDIARNNRLKA
jgi:beta-glucosidase